ncbi:MAG: tryptophan--tRNA ligase [Candidatus Paceibacterota bacterium]
MSGHFVATHLFDILLRMSKKILVSGIQASGRLHFGNYFAVVKPNIELANGDEFEPYIFIADYHALTTVKNAEDLRRSTHEIVAAYVACGLDLSKAILFKQSDVPAHTELCVILNNIVTVPYLMRAHAFKDHEAKSKEVNAGLFDYPVLMAADILMYQADIVPVGSDQKQHVEYARDIAGFYNRAWNVEQFKLPKEYIVPDVATVPGIDGEKMSKSKGNVISLFGSDEEVKKAVMSIVTDSATPEEKKNPDTNNVYAIHKLFLSTEEDAALRAKFEDGGYGYKQAKDDLLATITQWREGKKETFDDLMGNPEKIKAILAEGGKKAQVKAQETMSLVRTQVGLQ